MTIEGEPQLDPVKKTEEFMAREFKKHPHYSFDDWTVMRDHSLKVRDLAMQISEGMSIDPVVVGIGALLHDIGKTYEADSETLHKNHEDFNFPVSESFLGTLPVTDDQREKIKSILEHKSDSVEMRIIEDADGLALYADKRLYMLFIKWARENSLDDAIQRKLSKIDRLHFQKSKEMGEEWLKQMRIDWEV